jgi:hypothetical protein
MTPSKNKNQSNQRRTAQTAMRKRETKTVDCMVFKRNFNDAFPELLFVAENPREAVAFAKGLETAKRLESPDDIEIFIGTSLPSLEGLAG